MAVQYTVKTDFDDSLKLQRRLSRLRPVLEAIGDVALEATREGFNRSLDPYGRKWKPIKPYIRYYKGQRRPRKSSDPPLLDTGETRESFYWQVRPPQGVVIRSNKPYIGFHQRGEGHLPQRLVLPERGRPPLRWRAAVIGALADEILEGVGRGQRRPRIARS